MPFAELYKKETRNGINKSNMTYRITPHITPGRYIRYNAHPGFKKVEISYLYNARALLSGYNAPTAYNAQVGVIIRI